MTHRIRFRLLGHVALIALLASVGPAHGQGFGSISSQPAAVAGTLPPPAPTAAPSATPVPAPQIASPGSPANAAPSAAASFASVSTPAPFGSVSSGAFASRSAATGAGPRLPGPAAGFTTADRILIEKAVRRLRLYREGAVIAEYPIKLGLNPYGHKQREGDFRTPDGEYRLSRRNPRSEFFLSLEVSYPNDSDLARARRAGVQPGGLIMIHGQPNVPRKSSEYYFRNDWTNGCIAVSNSDMVDIWLRTGVGTAIEIRP